MIQSAMAILRDAALLEKEGTDETPKSSAAGLGF